MRTRNWIAVAAHRRTGAGKHKNKGLRGTGKGRGRRHPKHRGHAPGKAER
jgi:hypothetical protein